MQFNNPICILCLRSCDSSGCLSSCNHFFCARCVPRLPPANPPSAPPQCPVCKKPYRLVSINSTAVQPLLQDPHSLLKVVSNQYARQRHVIARMQEALKALKEEVKTIERKYREKSAALDRALHQQQQLQRQYSSQLRQGQQPGTPCGQSCPSSFAVGGAAESLLVQGGCGNGVGVPLGFGSSHGSRQRAFQPPPPATQGSASMPLSRMPSTFQQRPAPPQPQQSLQGTPSAAGPLGWSATSGILLPQHQHKHPGSAHSGLSRHGDQGVAAAAAASDTARSRNMSKPQDPFDASSAFYLFTPLNSSRATPDLLWPR